jgi:small-conductance mechanosensitive channel
MLTRQSSGLLQQTRSTLAAEPLLTCLSGMPGASASGRRRQQGGRLIRRFLLWICILLLINPMLQAQVPETEPAAPESTQPTPVTNPEPALLSIGSSMVIVFRATVFGYTPEQRVGFSQVRIHNAVRDRRPATFSTQERAEGVSIYYGDHVLLMVAHGDVDPLSGESMEQTVEGALDALKLYFDQYRRGRDPKVILWGVLQTVIYTIVFILLVGGLFILLTRVEGRIRKRLAGREMMGELLMDAVINLRRLIYSLLIMGLILLWLSLVLESFPQTENTGANLTTAFTSSLRDLFSGTIDSLPNLMIAAVIFAIVFSLIRSVNTLLNAVLSGKIKLASIEDDAARPTATVIKILLILIGLITAFPYLPGTSTGAFQGISLMAGLIVSLGSATLFAQISAGFVLMYSRSFKRGDWLMLADGTEGRLMETGYLTTRLQTYHEQMSIPNLVLLGQPIRNLSRGPIPDVGLLTVRLTIGYNTPWRQVYRLLLDASDIPGILTNPAPKVFQLELGDFYITYQLTAYISLSTPRIAMKSSLLESIVDSFNKEGVQIMSPHYVLDPDEKVWVPTDQWDPKAQSATSEPPPTQP